ncbi:hypothetical protein AJ88_20195 [Mesorhizobium amorphae CCBAU 01583]|nr:hypothetical protein AJ88_20195 [Mesorhizobium amorphae CCBAU 01583]
MLIEKSGNDTARCSSPSAIQPLSELPGNVEEDRVALHAVFDLDLVRPSQGEIDLGLLAEFGLVFEQRPDRDGATPEAAMGVGERLRSSSICSRKPAIAPTERLSVTFFVTERSRWATTPLYRDTLVASYSSIGQDGKFRLMTMEECRDDLDVVALRTLLR